MVHGWKSMENDIGIAKHMKAMTEENDTPA